MKKLFVFFVCLISIAMLYQCTSQAETPMKQLHVYWDLPLLEDVVDSAATHMELWSCNSLGEPDTLICDSVLISALKYPIKCPADGKLHNVFVRSYCTWGGKYRVAQWSNVADSLMPDERIPATTRHVWIDD